MIKNILITFAFFVTSLVISSAVNAEVTITNSIFEVVTVTAENGSKSEQWQTPDKLLPGERVGYQIDFENKSDEPAAEIVIVNPIPKHTLYVPGSAKGLNTLIEFSADGGKTFALPTQLFIEKDGERVLAETTDYTQVRWSLQKPLTAKASGSVQYVVKIK
ncbi:MAG: hypothetical protein V7765_18115 [Oleispira sp.]